MPYGGIQERLKLGASVSLGASSSPVWKGAGPARTTAQRQRANPAMAVRGGHLSVHTALIGLVLLEMLLLCCGRAFFAHDHGG